MDLGTVQKNLAEDCFENPTDVCKDTRLIFANAKAYTPNKRSKVVQTTNRCLCAPSYRLNVTVDILVCLTDL